MPLLLHLIGLVKNACKHFFPFLNWIFILFDYLKLLIIKEIINYNW